MGTDIKKKVLVVDDEKDLRDAMSTALSYEGYEVQVATDGIEAFETAARFHPDIILLDIMMPRQDGITTLKAIRQESWGKNMPILIMTVLDDMNKIAEAIESGATEYLVKTDIPLGSIVQKVKDRLSL